MHSIILQHSALKRLESLAWKRAAIKTQMICLTSFFCSCEYASDIFPHVFSPTGGFVPKTVERGQKNIGRREIWKKCKGREIKRGRTWGQCGCHQRRKSAITVMVTDSVQWTRHTSSAIGKMTPAPVWNPWSFHLREIDAFIKRNYVVITHTSWHCYSRFVKKYLLAWWGQSSN